MTSSYPRPCKINGTLYYCQRFGSSYSRDRFCFFLHGRTYSTNSTRVSDTHSYCAHKKTMKLCIPVFKHDAVQHTFFSIKINRLVSRAPSAIA